jgi:beta-galactosidase
MKDGKIIQTVEIHTTGAPARLAMAADQQRIHANPSDVAHVTVQVLDAKGLVVPTADDEIAFTIQGQGHILGVDNGRPDSHEDYKGSSRKAFNGLALVILQATGYPGTITLSASALSLSPAQITIEAG